MSWIGNWTARLKSSETAAEGKRGFWFWVGKRRARSRDDNPCFGLTIQRAIRLMESYLQGDFADLMWTFGAPYIGIESADPDYLSIIDRRQGALKELNWQIARWDPDANDDDPRNPVRERLAKDQAVALERAYERMSNVYEAIAHLNLAKFRGFSIVEPDEAAGEFIPVDHWNVRRDGTAGDWFFNPEAEIGASLENCEPFDPGRIIVLEAARPIGRIALLKYIRANLSEQDWDHFVEIYGIPSGVVIAPDNVDAQSMEAFKKAAAAARAGADAAFPAGTIYTPNDQPRGTEPFQPRLEWLSQKLVQAGTGGFLTMLSSAGSGTLAGSAHMEAFRILARADARDISEAFQKCFDLRVLTEAGLLRPGEPPLAWFEISSREEQDSGDASRQVVAMSQFFDLDEQQVMERTGWKVTRKVLPAAAPSFGGFSETFRSGGHPVPERQAGRIAAAAAALLADLAPVRELMSRTLRECGGDLKAAVVEMAKELPNLQAKLMAGELDEVLEGIVAEEVAAVLEKTAPESPRNDRKGKDE